MSSLESILSGGATASEPEATTPVVKPETPGQPQGQPEPSSDAEPQADETGKVPLAALHAERSKVKRYTEQVAEFQAKIDQQNAQWEQRFSQILTAVAPKQPQAEAAPQPEIWDDPNAFVRSQAAEMVNPLQQQMKAMAREVAEVRYQPDVVAKAVDAFDNAVISGKLDPVVHQRILASPNPYAAAVQWHQHTSTMSEIGSDPAAYKAKLAEEIRAEVMAELQAGNTPAGNQSAPVMPSNFATARSVGTRAGPAWSGPTALDDIFKRK